MCNKDCMECGMNVVNNKCSCGMDKKPHKHAELIKAWADGAIVQVLNKSDIWVDTYLNQPCWYSYYEYRIKPEPKPDVVLYTKLTGSLVNGWSNCRENWHNVIATYDGESGKLKSVELIKENS